MSSDVLRDWAAASNLFRRRFLIVEQSLRN